MYVYVSTKYKQLDEYVFRNATMEQCRVASFRGFKAYAVDMLSSSYTSTYI